jgi:DNA replication protein DnaC
VGKTHLAVALGLRAIEQGFGVYFVRAQDLFEDLRQAQAEHRLDRRMRVYLAPKLLIIDEFGVWPYDRLAATAFFSLIAARYERGSILLTSNKGFGEWGEVPGDPIIATAILDRLLHHSHVLNIRGESYRLREKEQAGLLGVSLAPALAIGSAEEDASPSTRPGVGQFSTGESGSRVRRR